MCQILKKIVANWHIFHVNFAKELSAKTWFAGSIHRNVNFCSWIHAGSRTPCRKTYAFCIGLIIQLGCCGTHTLIKKLIICIHMCVHRLIYGMHTQTSPIQNPRDQEELMNQTCLMLRCIWLKCHRPSKYSWTNLFSTNNVHALVL